MSLHPPVLRLHDARRSTGLKLRRKTAKKKGRQGRPETGRAQLRADILRPISRNPAAPP
ncbi:hypothetical protein HZZ13_20810 [Bradyrhizobium sp. CNPSo 4010]|uniref:50S ribosomal protein L15 n=1 Tax=Bradyrhizobium agreste TaxID=2751811 RepID=A0ABS0PSP4_9BRAD|nr:hypothetical protein [Bradyrhizobium agreste]MBH5400214.1 hypothetical protein [Bradyrhizobium agreste]